MFHSALTLWAVTSTGVGDRSEWDKQGTIVMDTSMTKEISTEVSQR